MSTQFKFLHAAILLCPKQASSPGSLARKSRVDGEGEWINCSIGLLKRVWGIGPFEIHTAIRVCFSPEVCCSERDLQNSFAAEKWAEILIDGWPKTSCFLTESRDSLKQARPLQKI